VEHDVDRAATRALDRDLGECAPAGVARPEHALEDGRLVAVVDGRSRVREAGPNDDGVRALVFAGGQEATQFERYIVV